MSAALNRNHAAIAVVAEQLTAHNSFKRLQECDDPMTDT